MSKSFQARVAFQRKYRRTPEAVGSRTGYVGSTRSSIAKQIKGHYTKGKKLGYKGKAALKVGRFESGLD